MSFSVDALQESLSTPFASTVETPGRWCAGVLRMLEVRSSGPTAKRRDKREN